MWNAYDFMNIGDKIQIKNWCQRHMVFSDDHSIQVLTMIEQDKVFFTWYGRLGLSVNIIVKSLRYSDENR